jgi:hypothetical protein
MPCHPPRYATISLPFPKTHAQEVILKRMQESGANLGKVEPFGSRMFDGTRNQISWLLTFVRRFQFSDRARAFDQSHKEGLRTEKKRADAGP